MRAFATALRKPVGAALLAVAAVGVAGVLTVGYAVAGWSSGTAGLTRTLSVLAATAVGGGVAGTLVWGPGRWRAVLGRVLAVAGMLGVTVAVTLPFVMRSEAWRVAGGPAFEVVPALGLAAVSMMVAVGGGVLAATQPGRRPILPDVRSEEPAPIRPRAQDVTSEGG